MIENRTIGGPALATRSGPTLRSFTMEDPDMEPTRPKPRRGDPQKPPEDRKVPGNNNLSLLIVAVIACVVLAAIFVPYGSSVVIKYGHLEQLIEKGAPSEKNKDPLYRRHGNAQRPRSDGPLFEPGRRPGGTERNHRESHAGGPRPGRRADQAQGGRGVHLLPLRAGSRQRQTESRSFTTIISSLRAHRLPVLCGTV